MNYSYRGINANGETEQGQEEGERSEVLVRLRERGVTVIQLQEKTSSGASGSWRFGLEWWGVSKNTVAYFTRQLAELLQAGIPLVEALDSLQRFSPSPRLVAILASISTDIQKGSSLSQAFTRHPQTFSPLYIALLAVGESTGTLTVMVGNLADYLERDMEIRAKMRSAMTYPLFILGFSLMLVYGMVAYLLPTFTPMWTSSGLDLNNYPVTLFLMRLSNLTKSFWDELIVAGVLAFGYYALRAYTATQDGGRQFDRLLLRIPIVGNFLLLSGVARIASTFGTMLNSGASFLAACERASEVAGNRVLCESLQQVSRDVAAGAKLSQAFERQSHAFPAMLVQMVAIGEQSGQLAGMMPRVARYYESQLDNSIKTFSSLIEPVMMVAIGGVVFVFVLGVFTPIMGIVGAMQNHM